MVITQTIYIHTPKWPVWMISSFFVITNIIYISNSPTRFLIDLCIPIKSWLLTNHVNQLNKTNPSTFLFHFGWGISSNTWWAKTIINHLCIMCNLTLASLPYFILHNQGWLLFIASIITSTHRMQTSLYT